MTNAERRHFFCIYLQPATAYDRKVAQAACGRAGFEGSEVHGPNEDRLAPARAALNRHARSRHTETETTRR